MATQNAIDLTQAGIVAYDGAGTFFGRTLTAGSGVSISDGDGVAGNPTITASGTVPITFDADTGTATASSNVLIVTGSGGVSSSASGNTLTYTFSATGQPTIATSYSTDSGSATPSLNTLTIAGGTGIDTSGSGSTVSIAFDVTEVPTIPTSIGTGSGTATPSGNNFVIAGGTGITTTGAGSTATINFSISGVPTIATTYQADVGSATPSGNSINLLGTSSQGLTTSAAGATVTFTNSNWSTTQKGVGTLATDAEAIAGSVTDEAVTPSSLKAKLGTQTAHSVALFEGNSSALSLASPTATSGIALVSTGAITDPAFGTTVVAGGGTGVTSWTTYGLIAGGTTSTGNLQQVSGTGTSGQILTSNGAGTLPTWQDPASSTKPLFIAKVTSTQSNVTGDGSNYNIIFSTVLINTGSGFDGTTTFTAPDTGSYMLGFDTTIAGVTTSHTYGHWVLTGTGTVINVDSPQVKPTSLVNGTGNQMNLSYSGLFLMTAGDTLTVDFGVSGGTKVVDVLSGKFWGYLVQ